jgi:hypothetical protein
MLVAGFSLLVADSELRGVTYGLLEFGVRCLFFRFEKDSNDHIDHAY